MQSPRLGRQYPKREVSANTRPKQQKAYLEADRAGVKIINTEVIYPLHFQRGHGMPKVLRFLQEQVFMVNKVVLCKNGKDTKGHWLVCDRDRRSGGGGVVMVFEWFDE
ncbi:unnamed protein product [Dovyalis caffra]|uniref:Uncharacterized protein n=1 Tax=Dovyalis caffra TaxID=77055 RepID=A0AAV1RFN9_9ROSI|nr:unnamed protein product [Dovyalis caffra]